MNAHHTALSTSARLRYLTFAALYTAQGIPEGLTFYAIPAWLAMNGVGAGPIGSYLAVIVLPWTFKLFAGPMMDRFMYLPMGRRRPWVVVGQLGLVISFLGMVFVPDPVHNITLLSIAGFIVSCFGALQDVATDGLAVDIVPPEQQARANGLMWGAKVIGTSASLALGTWLINSAGFPYAVGALSLGIALIMLVPLLIRERPGEKRVPWGVGAPSEEALAMKVDGWSEILLTLRKAFALRDSLWMCALALVFTIGMGFMDALLPLFTIQELGWTNDAYSNILAAVSMGGAIAAVAIAGWLVDRIGKLRIMIIYLVLFASLTTAMAFTRPMWTTTGYATGLIIGYQTLYTFFMVAMLATGMNLSWKRVSATQFTLFMAMGNLGRAIGSSLLGPMRARLDWPGMFLFFTSIMALAVMVTYAIKIPRHLASLDRLENDFLSERSSKEDAADVYKGLGDLPG